MVKSVSCSLLLAALIVAGSVSSAFAVSSDGSIFFDEFNDLSSWTVSTDCDPGAWVSDGILKFQSYDSGSGSWLGVFTTSPLNYGSTSEWVIEMKFLVGNANAISSTNRETALLMGMSSVGSGWTVDFGMLLMENVPGESFNLAWGKFYDPDNEPEIVGPVLSRNAWYTMTLHHTSDDTVDIYVDGTLVASKASFTGATKPAHIGIYEGSFATVAYIEVDYVSVGLPASGPSAAIPYITPRTGTYSEDQLVTITCATPGATIRYTTDGSTPTESSAVYTAPFIASPGTTITAKSWAAGYSPSAAASVTYYQNIMSNGSIFYDDFDDLSKWVIQETDCNPGLSVSGGIAKFDTTAGIYLNACTTEPLNYGGASEWVTQARFRVIGGNPLSYYEPPTVWRESGLLVGLKNRPYGTTVEYGLLLEQNGSAMFNLNWGRINNTQPETLALNLNLNQWYTVAMYHKPDSSVDIFLDGEYTTTKPAIEKDGSVQATYINLIESASLTSCNIDYDYISVGAPVTELSAAVPNITPGTGAYTGDQLVTITCSTPGATIRYTTDGSTPTESSTLYTAPFVASPGTTVKAIAWAVGYAPSAVAAVTYHIYVTSDGSVFYDDFNDLAQWTYEGDCIPGPTVAGSILNLDSTTGMYLNLFTTDALNYGTLGEWVTETRFRVIYGGPLSYYEPGNNLYRETGLLVGLNSKPSGWTADYGLLLETGTSSELFNLTWGEFNSTAPSALVTGLNKNQWYTAVLYHRVDGNVSIFLDGVYLGEKPAILFGGDSQAKYIGVVEGSFATSAIYDVDYISVGAPTSGGLKVAAPSISPGSGTYYLPQWVTITCSTEGATIRYTTDGTTPTESSAVYSAPFLANPGTTVTARAWAAGYEPSVFAKAVYSQADLDRPQYVKYSDSVVIDGSLADWSDADWAPLDQIYHGDPQDIDSGSEYAIKWGEAGERVYVAVKVLDTDHYFTDTYTDWDARDAVEIYLHTTGSSPDKSFALSEAAQQYTVGVKPSLTSFWTQLGYVGGAGEPHENAVPAGANFQAAATVSGMWIYYEAAMTPFEYFGEFAAQPSVISTLAGGQVIGVDVVAAGRDSSAYTGMRSENTKTGKSGDYSRFGRHLLLPPATAFGQVKEGLDGSWVSVSGTVTAAFHGYFYVESSDRSSGIRVVRPGYSATVGSAAFVSGTIDTAETGERYISAVTVHESAGTALEPLAMTNKALGGGAIGAQEGVSGAYGLNNIGLLVKTAGKVSNPTGATFVVSDGSGVALTVAVPDGQPLPAGGAYVSVTGISSCDKAGGNIERRLLVTGWAPAAQ